MINFDASETENEARRKKPTFFDLVIVGGGLIGKTLALALSHTSLKIAIIEATPPSTLRSTDFDARSIALSLASQKILAGLGLWEDLAPFASPIERIHVSEKNSFSATRLKASEHRMPAFGYVSEISYLNRVFQKALSENLSMYTPFMLTSIKKEETHYELTLENKGQETRLQTRLLVGADGANSTVRRLVNMPVHQKQYHQHAIVANIGLQRGHHYTAYERFMGKRLMALLPMTKSRSALVWAVPKNDVVRLLALSDNEFLHTLQDTFGYRLGRFTTVGQRQSFPLSYSYMPKTTADGLVFLGNAAHGLHPIAGQGFNLGLRDAAQLAECLSLHERADMKTALKAYEAKRCNDQKRVRQFTDRLIHLFGTSLPGFSLLRDMGLFTIDNAFPLKEAFVHYAAGFSQVNSRLASGFTLLSLQE